MFQIHCPDIILSRLGSWTNIILLHVCKLSKGDIKIKKDKNGKNSQLALMGGLFRVIQRFLRFRDFWKMMTYGSYPLRETMKKHLYKFFLCILTQGRFLRSLAKKKWQKIFGNNFVLDQIISKAIKTRCRASKTNHIKTEQTFQSLALSFESWLNLTLESSSLFLLFLPEKDPYGPSVLLEWSWTLVEDWSNRNYITSANRRQRQFRNTVFLFSKC